MAIIITPKGWAIEFENDYSHKDTESKARDLASEYETTLNSLLTTMHTAQSNEGFKGVPDYYTFQLLEAMLPTGEDATAFFREKLLREKRLFSDKPE